MITALKFWNEPNNVSHWDSTLDPEWRDFSEMTRLATQRVRDLAPELTLVLGGISPIGQRRPLPTLLDESAILLATVYVSGGRRGLDIGLAPDDLLAVTGGAYAAIGRAERS